MFNTLCVVKLAWSECHPYIHHLSLSEILLEKTLSFSDHHCIIDISYIGTSKSKIM